MTKETKSKIVWVVGLLAAILTAVLGYLNTSCTAGRSTAFHADSLYINQLHYEHSTNASVNR